MVEQKRKEVKNLQEGLRLRQESLDVQQRQRRQVGSEGMCGWKFGDWLCGCVGNGTMQ